MNRAVSSAFLGKGRVALPKMLRSRLCSLWVSPITRGSPQLLYPLIFLYTGTTA